MNLILVIILFIIFLIPLWLLFGKNDAKSDQIGTNRTGDLGSEQERGRIPVEPDLPDARLPDRGQDISQNRPEEFTSIGDDFNLPNDNRSIINEESPFSIYRRTLDNAQYYMEQGDFDTAQDLYNGLLQRISDSDIREKIEDNIDYLNNYQQVAATREREEKKKSSAMSENDIRLTVSGQEFIPENIKIDITPPSIQPKLDVQELVDSITGHMSHISPIIEESREQIGEIREYRDELEQVKNEIRNLYDLKEESQRIREERIDTDLDRIKELKDQIERENLERIKNSEIDSLRREVELLRTEQSARLTGDDDLSSMQSQMEELRNELQKSASAQGEINGLKETIQALRSELHHKERDSRDVSLLSQQLNTLINQMHSSSVETDEMKDILDQIQSLQKTFREGEQNFEQINLLRNEMESLTGKLLQESHKNRDMEQIRDEIRSLGSRLQEKEDSLGQISDLQSQIQQLKGDLSDRDKSSSEIAELKNHIADLQKDLNQHRSSSDEMSALKEKINRLESERLQSINDSSRGETDALKEQIAVLKDELERSRLETSRSDELKKLHETIADLEQKSHTRELNAQQLESLRNEIQHLAQDASLSAEMEQKIDRIVKEGLAGLPDRDMRTVDDLTRQIDTLKDELINLQNRTPSGAPLPQAPPPAAAEEQKPHIQPGTAGKMEEQSPSGMQPSQKTESSLSIGPQKEDKKEDFETLQEHINGPVFDEPSEDEILEKILQDTARNQERDYEIRGTEDSNDISGEFDISKLFAPPQSAQGDEEFYSQFMERNKPRVKKELPILQVSYRFDKLPELSSLSKESNIIESTFYKYKDLLEKANEHIKRRQVNNALNYYETVLAQDIPEEFKRMIQKNITDLNEYLEKYMLNM